jgi:hypothetical protein
MDLQRRDPHPALWIAGRDAFSSIGVGDKEKAVVGVKSIVWSQNPNKLIRSGVLVGAHGLGGAAYQTYETYSPEDNADLLISDPLTSLDVARLGAGGWIRDEGPFRTLGDLDGRNLTVYMTKPLFELVSEVHLLANQYVITRMLVDRLVALDQEPHLEWPEPLSQEESSTPWVVVLIKTSDPDTVTPYWTNWSLEFSRYTPRKLPLQPQINTPSFEDT